MIKEEKHDRLMKLITNSDAEWLNSTHKLLLFTILVYVWDSPNRDEWCFPSHGRLASNCCVTSRTIQRSLSDLEKNKLIFVKHNQLLHLTNAYKLNESELIRIQRSE